MANALMMMGYESPSSAFVGPLDGLPAPLVAVSFRRLLSSWTSSLDRVRRSSDNAEQDIGYIANGAYDASAANAFIGGGSGFEPTWYDQSGNATDAMQGTAANQPGVVTTTPANCTFDGANSILTGTATLPSVLTYAAWVNVTSVAASSRTIIGGSASGCPQFVVNTSSQLQLTQQQVAVIAASTGTISTGVWAHCAVTYDASGNYVFYINGSSAGSGTNLKTITPRTLQIGSGAGTSSQKFFGSLGEVLIWDSVLTPTQIATLYATGQ